MRRLRRIAGTVLVLGVMAGLAMLGNSNASLTTLVGIVGLASVAAFQGTLAAVIASLRLRLSPLFGPGETIQLPNGITGTVTETAAFTVAIRLDDGRIHYEPTVSVASGGVTVGAIPPTPQEDTHG